MGTRKRAGKQKQRGTYSDWNTAARTIKRNELDIVASICGTTQNQVGKVFEETSDYNDSKDDGATAADERASESTPIDSDTSTTTV